MTPSSFPRSGASDFPRAIQRERYASRAAVCGCCATAHAPATTRRPCATEECATRTRRLTARPTALRDVSAQVPVELIRATTTAARIDPRSRRAGARRSFSGLAPPVLSSRMARGNETRSGARSGSGEHELSPLRLVDAAARGHRRGLVAITAAAGAGGVLEAVVLLMIARLAVALASGDSTISTSLGPLGEIRVSVPAVVGVAAGLTILRVALQLVQARLITRTFASVWSDVRARIMRAYVDASWSLQSGERDGKIQELVTTYATNAAGTILSLAQVLVALVSLLAFLLTAFLVNLIAALVVLTAGTLVALLLRPLRIAVRGRARAASNANLGYATEMTEFAANLQEVRVFNVEGHVVHRIMARIREVSELDRRARYLTFIAPALYQGMALLLVLGAIGLAYASDVSSLSSLGGIVLIMVRALSYGQQLQTSYQALYSSAPYFEMLASEERRYDEAAVRRDGDQLVHVGTLTFDRVSYEYEPGRPVLHDISFEIEPGDLVGIIGPSGSGKSTLVQLVLRLREPTSGLVLAAGQDVRQFSTDSWYRRVSLVPQEPKLFAGTVSENIRFYRDDVDDSAIERGGEAGESR